MERGHWLAGNLTAKFMPQRGEKQKVCFASFIAYYAKQDDIEHHYS